MSNIIPYFHLWSPQVQVIPDFKKKKSLRGNAGLWKFGVKIYIPDNNEEIESDDYNDCDDVEEADDYSDG